MFSDIDQPPNDTFHFVLTKDDSLTLYDPEYKEHHHSLVGAYTEAKEKFIKLTKEWLNILKDQPHTIEILDLPFGLGYNHLVLIDECPQLNIYTTAIEKDPSVIKLISEYPDEHELKRLFQNLNKLDHSQYKQIINKDNWQLELWIEDLFLALPQLYKEDRKYDFIYYDPFSPRSCPDFWSESRVLFYLSKILKPEGLFITYSSSNKVRKALQNLGLYIAPSIAVGRKMPGTIASFSPRIHDLGYEFSTETLKKIEKAQAYQ